MVGDPARTDALAERFQFGQVIEVDRVGAADGKRNAMEHNRVPFRDLIDYIQWPPAGIQVVLRQDLEPIDPRLVFEDVLEMDTPQADAETQVRIAPTIIRHALELLPSNANPPPPHPRVLLAPLLS